jgi:hypothetical protein
VTRDRCGDDGMREKECANRKKKERLNTPSRGAHTSSLIGHPLDIGLHIIRLDVLLYDSGNHRNRVPDAYSRLQYNNRELLPH